MTRKVQRSGGEPNSKASFLQSGALRAAFVAPHTCHFRKTENPKLQPLHPSCRSTNPLTSTNSYRLPATAPFRGLSGLLKAFCPFAGRHYLPSTLVGVRQRKVPYGLHFRRVQNKFAFNLSERVRPSLTATIPALREAATTLLASIAFPVVAFYQDYFEGGEMMTESELSRCVSRVFKPARKT